MPGILHLPFWGYILIGLALTQLTIASVTIYLHRYQTHRALTLHPVVSHLFRFWLWLSTGMVTAEWVAIHRKHHATTDVEGDPHSPKVKGIKKVFWQVPELYREAAKDKEMIEKYSHGTPNDWIERKLYSRYPSKGIFLMFLLDLFFFGTWGITMWAVQMLWIPLSAGIINGVGHHWGYRNFECHDASTNVFPWGLFIGGEELHNNHHTFASSAKFSVKPWEFDLGWVYIRCLSFLKLARVKKLPPKIVQDENKLHVDLETVKAVIGCRFKILADYYKLVIRPILHHERKQSSEDKADKQAFYRAGRLLRREGRLLSPHAKRRLQLLLDKNENLKLVHRYRQSLQNIWLTTSTSQNQLIESLQQWCEQAEASGLQVLKKFATQLKSYRHEYIS